MTEAVLFSLLAFVLLTTGGNIACRFLFSVSGLRKTNPDSDAIRAGRIIGSLERIILAIGLLAHSWEVLAAVIALKTVGRFKELDDKLPAEYFLVGSLFSLLWAVVITGSWLAYDQNYGLDWYEAMKPLLEEPASPVD